MKAPRIGVLLQAIFNPETTDDNGGPSQNHNEKLPVVARRLSYWSSWVNSLVNITTSLEEPVHGGYLARPIFLLW